MKYAFVGLLCAVLVGPFSSPAYAVNCSGVTYLELMQKLRDVHFPLALLSKVHVGENELRAQGVSQSAHPSRPRAKPLLSTHGDPSRRTARKAWV